MSAKIILFPVIPRPVPRPALDELAQIERETDEAVRRGREAARSAFELLRRQRSLIASLTPAGLPGNMEEEGEQ